MTAREARILVVEDNPTNRQLATIILKKLGHAADTAETGVEALSAVRRGRYEVVLMDLQMPDMDGIEATRLIRGLGSAITQPYVIAVTANVMREDRERCDAAGMDAFLAKPYQADELRRLVEQGFAAQAAAANVHAQIPKPPTSGTIKEEAMQDIHHPMLDAERVNEVIDVICDGEPDAFKRWIERLDAELTKFNDVVAANRTAPDLGVLRERAHSLKGTALVMGAKVLGDLFAQLETDARNGSFAQFSEHVETLPDVGAQSLAALRAVSDSKTA